MLTKKYQLNDSQQKTMDQNLDMDESAFKDAIAVIKAESRALNQLQKHIDARFTAAVNCILACHGRVVVTGLGKSGLVGQKISATLASTGTPSLFLHATEALHGDLGRITSEDVVLALSNSGNSDEIMRLIKPLKSLGVPLLAMTSSTKSALACHADILLCIGDIAEACPMGLVPTASTTVMMVLGDALAIALFNKRGFGREEYARFHPGGELGRKLLQVSEVMRKNEENPVVAATAPLYEAIRCMSDTPGHPGSVSITDEQGNLIGFFTDGDLRRLILTSEFNHDSNIAAVMHHNPKRIRIDALVDEAAHLLREYHIDQLPVVDANDKPVGLIDIQDLLSTRQL
ncbi:MAG: KpsF/GutQ family sugar-phosphate isomerase [Deltaproteobacteria bacterium]|nr:KpsF/GutQ family sugar-phosphate isomerase [Deltaproteobacteria bacterium]